MPLVVASPLEDNLRGSETVLLVEDDEMVRALTQAILERYGYTVLATRTVRDAMCFAEADPRPVHLLLTDTIMPGMNGPELAKQLLVIRSHIKVLYMSGYTDKVFPNSGSPEPGTRFIQKPFTPQTLARKVRDVLNAIPPTSTAHAV
jgi:two-component system, cell cycle sensor histidine kinase and response regulator CckA